MIEMFGRDLKVLNPGLVEGSAEWEEILNLRNRRRLVAEKAFAEVLKYAQGPASQERLVELLNS